MAAYHYADFTDAVAEAAHFKSVAGSDAKILDVEMSTNTVWMGVFRIALPTTNMLYGSGSSVPRNLFSYTWEASYGQPNPSGPCQLWQNTDALTVGGITAPVDGSIWMGTPEEYAAFFGSPAPVAPKPKPPYIHNLLLL